MAKGRCALCKGGAYIFRYHEGSALCCFRVVNSSFPNSVKFLNPCGFSELRCVFWMLPRPATFSISTHSSYRLFGRARVTNLGVYLLLGALLLSLAANWRQWLANNNDPHYHMPYGQRLSLDSSLQPLRNISNLIVVAGHAVFQVWLYPYIQQLPH